MSSLSRITTNNASQSNQSSRPLIKADSASKKKQARKVRQLENNEKLERVFLKVIAKLEGLMTNAMSNSMECTFYVDAGEFPAPIRDWCMQYIKPCDANMKIRLTTWIKSDPTHHDPRRPLVEIQNFDSKTFIVYPPQASGNIQTSWNAIRSKIDRKLGESIIEEIKSSYHLEMNDCINLLGKKVFPKESFAVHWDSLSQLILDKQPFSKSEKKQLALGLINFWTKLHWNLHAIQLYRSDARFYSLNLKLAVKLLSEVESQIGALPGNSNEFICQIKQSLAPLLNLLQKGLNLPPNLTVTDSFGTTSCKDEFVQFVNALMSSTIERFGRGFENRITSAKSNRNWLVVKANILKHYLVSKEQNFADIAALNLALGKKIPSLIIEEKWTEAYQCINSFNTSIEESICSANSPEVHKQTIFYLIRAKSLVESLRNHFEFIVTQGGNVSFISEAALDQLKLSQKELLLETITPKNIGQEIYLWARSMGDRAANLLQTLKALKTCCANAKGLKEFILRDDINKGFTDLLKSVKKGNQREITTQYNALALQLKEALIDWKENLQQTNQLIIQIQREVFLLLADPNLPKIEISILQANCKAINQNLLTLVQPINIFFSAFQQLLRTENMDVKGSPSSDFTLALLQEQDGDFAPLIKLVQQLQKAPLPDQVEETLDEDNMDFLEIAEEIPIDKPGKSIESQRFLEDFENVFLENKRRVLRKKIVTFLTNHQIPCSASYGKGDHELVYIGKYPIPIPRHKEIAIGTFKSIKEIMRDNLKDYLK